MGPVTNWYVLLYNKKYNVYHPKPLWPYIYEYIYILLARLICIPFRDGGYWRFLTVICQWSTLDLLSADEETFLIISWKSWKKWFLVTTYIMIVCWNFQPQSSDWSWKGYCSGHSILCVVILIEILERLSHNFVRTVFIYHTQIKNSFFVFFLSFQCARYN